MPANSSLIFIEDKNIILEYLESRSASMSTYIRGNSASKFTLWSKNLTHSDLANSGKRNGNKEGLDKNLLYYLSIDDMRKIEDANDKPFESAKQSNIGICEDFYADLGVPRLERRNGPQTTQHEHIKLNDYVDVNLVNDTIEYFKIGYTKKILQALEKQSNKWSDDESVTLNSGIFTSIQLTEAIHGLGTAADVEFHKLRLSMFCNDTIILLIEHCSDKNKLFIMLEKNPRFFTLCGLTNTTWQRYLETAKVQEKAAIKAKNGLDVDDEKTRAKQSAWKSLLAKEMMNYTTHEGEVFCPFTQINADFESVKMLFIASHIKRFADSNNIESYDVNNGLLLCANADALFDKHMITVDENKQLVFSFLIEKNYVLKQKLLLNQPIFDLILNEKRMEYMKDHRVVFYKKEKERKAI